MAGRRLASLKGLRYIYIIECQGRHKIGVANDPSARLAQLKNAAPFPLRLMAVFPCYGPKVYLVESAAHRTLVAQRVAREWFTCSFDEAEAAVSAALAQNGVPRLTLAEVGEKLGAMYLAASKHKSPVSQLLARRAVTELVEVTRRL